MSTGQLQELLDTSRNANARAAITGALLYFDGTFMQVLEGDQRRVQNLYTRLEVDPRHYDVTFLIDGETPTRQFEDWSMAFRHITEEADPAAAGEFSDFLTSRERDYGPNPTVAQRLLLSFRRSLTHP